jgi:hypothetical protein
MQGRHVGSTILSDISLVLAHHPTLIGQLRSGQSYRNLGATQRRSIDVDRSTTQLGDFLHHGQSYALPAYPFVQARTALQHMFALLYRNPWSVIFNDE